MLPQLLPAAAGDVDVVVSLGAAEPPRDGVDVYGHVASLDAVCLRFPEVGSFLVTADAIVCEPSAGLHEDVLRTFVLGPAIGTLLHLRGELVLHASSVAFGEAAGAFLGDTEFGKSTTAAACVLVGGARLVADDILLVRFVADGVFEVVPAFPRIKCWPESLRALGLDPDGFRRVHPELDKRDVLVPESFADGPVALRALYVLGEGIPAVAELDPQAAFGGLVANSYAVDLLDATGALERHFSQVTRLLASVPAVSLATGDSLADVRSVPALVEADLRGRR